MPSEKDKSFLKPSNYKINGNLLRAFYDKRGKLVFVLDSTIDKLKPNVLLVMDTQDDRKWDDILSNDYHMDLELVRPKKDNKYQKLDINYDGLSVYENLIDAYNEGGNVKQALKELDNFRHMTVRRSTRERLNASMAIAENARETIERTNDTIVELKAKIKSLRAKLTTLRRGIGKEPTKQSAAKILKAEAQLDVLTHKLERAQKRLENANKRLAIAEDDIATARKILTLLPDGDVENIKKSKAKSVPQKKKVTPAPEPFDDDEDEEEEYDDDDEDANETSDDDEWESDDNADDADDDTDDQDDETNDDDDEVKPLFDKDPNIMDEKIAFKPISFDEQALNQSAEEPEVEDVTETEEIDEPKDSFEPSKQIMDMVDLPNNYDDSDNGIKLDDAFASDVNTNVQYEAPTQMPDSLTTMETEDIHETETTPFVSQEQFAEPSLSTTDTDAMSQTEQAPQGINLTSVTEQPATQPTYAPAPTATENMVRPPLPLGQAPVVADVPQTNEKTHKPNLLYYILLVVLIALSVFTLWLYQRSNVSPDGVPVLVAQETVTTQQEATQEPVATKDQEPDTEVDDENYDPFVGDSDNTAQQVSLSEAAKSALTKVEKMAEKEDTEAKPVSPAEPDTVTNTVDTAQETEAVETPVETEQPTPDTNATNNVKEQTVNKPAYSVSQEDVFVEDTQNDISGGNLCEDGAAPDINGCCPGETFIKDGDQPLCCNSNEDCFPPLF